MSVNTSKICCSSTYMVSGNKTVSSYSQLIQSVSVDTTPCMALLTHVQCIYNVMQPLCLFAALAFTRLPHASARQDALRFCSCGGEATEEKLIDCEP